MSFASHYPAHSVGPPPKPPTEEDILDLVDKEEGELLAVSLVDEIMFKTKTVIFEKHIESQVLPYAVKFSKDTILALVEWQFLKRDAGLVPQSNWLPDEEPSTVPIDTWARGCVPVRSTPQAPPKLLAAASSLHNLRTSRAALNNAGEDTVKSTAKAEEKLASSLPKRRTTETKASSTAKASKEASPPAKKPPIPANPLVSKKTIKDKEHRGKLQSPSPQSPQKAKALPPLAGPVPSSAPKAPQQKVLMINKTLASLAANAESRLAPNYDRFVEEENRRTFEKIARIERDGGTVEFSYDSTGRVVLHHRNASEKRQRALRQIIKAKIPVSSTTMADSGRNLIPLDRDTVLSPTDSVTSLLAAATNGRPIYTEDPTTTAQSIADSIRLAPGAVLHEGSVTRRGPPPSSVPSS